MTTETLRTPSDTSISADFGAEVARVLDAVADGWRATRDWDRLAARRGNITRQQAAREVFRHNFA